MVLSRKGRLSAALRMGRGEPFVCRAKDGPYLAWDARLYGAPGNVGIFSAVAIRTLERGSL